MVSFESLKIEYKTGAALGVVALVLSSAVGLAAGNTALYTFGRALFLCIVFACLGTGLTMLLRKYVPEIFDSSFGASSSFSGQSSTGAVDVEGLDSSAGVSAASAPVSSSFDSSADASAGAGDPGFVPLGEYVEGQKQYGDEHLQTRPGSRSVGKHLLEEKGMKYEPKIIAEAIRTMMSKDQ
jgi:hypothetical protein